MWQCLAVYLAGSFAALQIVDVLTNNMGLPDWVFPFALVLLVIGLPIVLATAIVQDRLPGQASPPRADRRAPEPGDYASPRAARRDATGSYEAPPAKNPSRADHRRSAGSDTRSAPVQDADGSGGTRHRLFTWKNALGGGALAAVLLFVVTAGFMYMRTNGIGPAGTLVAKGVIDERSPVIVAEFESSEEDADLARAMTEAFRIDFSQTRIVKLVEPGRVSEALRRMELDPSTPLTPDIARRLARREGIPAVIGGSFSRVPGGFVLTGRIEDPAGTVLVSHRETASDSTAVLPAIDALSEKLRERLGESFTSLRADAPLERVTTSSLRALELYSQAIRTIEYDGDEEAGIRLLEEALEADPEFASAWRKLGVSIRNLRGSTARLQEALTRAYELRDRLTPRERYLAEASYHTEVTMDFQRAIDAYERMLDLDPNDAWALNNVAILYGELGDLERDLELTERAAALDTSATSVGNVAMKYLEARRIDEADSVVSFLRARFPTDHRVVWMPVLVAVHREDYAAAESLARAAVGEADGVGRIGALWALHGVLMTTGRLREANDIVDRAARLAGDLGFPGSEYDAVWPRFWEQIIVHEDPGAARRVVEGVLRAAPLEELDPLDRPYLGLAGLYGRLGDAERARQLVAEFKRAVPDAPRARWEDDEQFIEADLALADGRWDDAVAGYEAWARLEPGCLDCMSYNLAVAHDSAGRADTALALYEKEIDRTGPPRMRQRATTLGPTLERMAELYDQQGDLDRAAAYYSRLADLWAEADPELQPRVERARARAEEIVRDRG